MSSLQRTVAIQAADGLVLGLLPPLLGAVARSAPGINLRFVPEAFEDTDALRTGRVDLEIGVLDHVHPETRTKHLITSAVVAVVRAQHRLARRPVDLAGLAAAEHVSASLRGRFRGPPDDLLEASGLRRSVPVVVPSHTAALLLAQASDLVCLVPLGLADDLLTRLGLVVVDVALELPPMPIGMAWHPRHDADAAHRWLRHQVAAIVDTG